MPDHSSIQNKVDVTVNVGAPVLLANTVGGRSVVPTVTAPEPGPQWNRNPAVIVAALVLFFPAGLFLMWKYASWSDTTKWAVSGFFFWPVWGVVVWKQRWSTEVRMGAIAAIVAMFALLFTPLSTVAVLAALAVFVWALVIGVKIGAPESLEVTSARDRIRHKLDTCHEIIESIERGIDLDLAATRAAEVREQYVLGLELRKEAYDLLEGAGSQIELAAAEHKASQALAELRTIRDEVGARKV